MFPENYAPEGGTPLPDRPPGNEPGAFSPCLQAEEKDPLLERKQARLFRM